MLKLEKYWISNTYEGHSLIRYSKWIFYGKLNCSDSLLLQETCATTNASTSKPINYYRYNRRNKREEVIFQRVSRFKKKKKSRTCRKWIQWLKRNIFNLIWCVDECLTCVLNKKALATIKIWLPTPSVGPAITTRYVIPSNGISTSNAFDALRYWRVSTLFADRSFVISTCAHVLLFWFLFFDSLFVCCWHKIVVISSELRWFNSMFNVVKKEENKKKKQRKRKKINFGIRRTE